MIDMHSHHQRCGHAKGNLEDYVKASIDKSLKCFGLSDHAPLFAHNDNHPMPHIQMSKEEFPIYIEEAVHLKDKFRAQIDIKVGVEADFIAGTEEIYIKALDVFPLDYIIGSVHWFGESHVFHPHTWNGFTSSEALYRAYFRTIQDAAQSGMFDVLGHIDAIKAMGPERPTNYEELVDTTLEVIVASGVAVEINTSGIRKCGETFPSPEIIKTLHDAGTNLTFGSDCHSPAEVAFGAGEVLNTLNTVEVSKLVIFEQRQPNYFDLPIPVEQ